MRQRGAGYLLSALAVVSSRLYGCPVLDLFLQALASSSRLALFKSTTRPRPSHHHPQAHRQLPLLKQNPTTYLHIHRPYKRQRPSERDLSGKKKTIKPGFRNGKGSRPNKKTQGIRHSLPLPNLSSTSHTKSLRLRRSQPSEKYESVSWSRDHAKRHPSIHNPSLRTMSQYLCQNPR